MARNVKQLGVMSVHEKRYLMLRGGKTVEQIAALEGCAVGTVERSITMIQGQRAMLTVPEMQMRQLDILNTVHPLEKQALAEALTAEIEVQIEDGEDEDGKPKYRMERVPDHRTRLQAEEVINAKVNALMPKSKGGIYIGVNQPGAPATDEGGTRSPVQGRSFEDIVRGIDEQRRLPAGNPALMPAEGEILPPETAHEPSPEA